MRTIWVVHYGIEIVTLGPLADPRRVVDPAVAAEEAGFEMVAVWDHVAFAWACRRPIRAHAQAPA